MKSAEMVKAARELAGWSQAGLAERSGVSLPTIQRMENPTHGPLRSSGTNIEKVRDAFTRSGVSFVSTDGRDCVCIDRKPTPEA